eukprot:CFRG4817T1
MAQHEEELVENIPHETLQDARLSTEFIDEVEQVPLPALSSLEVVDTSKNQMSLTREKRKSEIAPSYTNHLAKHLWDSAVDESTVVPCTSYGDATPLALGPTVLVSTPAIASTATATSKSASISASTPASTSVPTSTSKSTTMPVSATSTVEPPQITGGSFTGSTNKYYSNANIRARHNDEAEEVCRLKDQKEPTRTTVSWAAYNRQYPTHPASRYDRRIREKKYSEKEMLSIRRELDLLHNELFPHDQVDPAEDFAPTGMQSLVSMFNKAWKFIPGLGTPQRFTSLHKRRIRASIDSGDPRVWSRRDNKESTIASTSTTSDNADMRKNISGVCHARHISPAEKEEVERVRAAVANASTSETNVLTSIPTQSDAHSTTVTHPTYTSSQSNKPIVESYTETSQLNSRSTDRDADDILDENATTVTLARLTVSSPVDSDRSIPSTSTNGRDGPSLARALSDVSHSSGEKGWVNRGERGLRRPRSPRSPQFRGGSLSTVSARGRSPYQSPSSASASVGSGLGSKSSLYTNSSNDGFSEGSMR